MMFSKSLILKKNYFFIFLNRFDVLILKIILEKLKKHYFTTFSKKIHFKNKYHHTLRHFKNY